MAIHRIRLNWVLGTLAALSFVSLLAYRVGYFQKGEDFKESHTFNAMAQRDRETWMNILRQGEKIGYAHRQFSKTADGCRIVESVFMKINTMGMVQDLQFRTEGHLHPDLTLSSFNFELQSSLFQFKARGVLKGNILTLFTGPSDSEQKIELPLEKDPQLSVGLLESLNSESLKPGDSRAFNVFDPATLTQRPVKIVVLSDETIPIMDHPEEARKVSIDWTGVSQLAWIGKDGTVLREEGPLGIKLEQVTKDKALEKISNSPGADLTEVASIATNKVLHDVNSMKEMTLKLDGIEVEGISLRGGRQTLRGTELTIRRETISTLSSRGKVEKEFSEGKRELEPTPLIQSEHPEILAKAREIVSQGDPDLLKANKLVKWVNENIQKRPVLSVPNALETLRNRVGDCNEHAVLLAALARASGIPAQVEAGVVYQKGRFYYHAWNVLYLGAWVTADSVMGQLPADVTHIRFVRGAEQQIDLIRIIGKLRLEILSTS